MGLFIIYVLVVAIPIWAILNFIKYFREHFQTKKEDQEEREYINALLENYTEDTWDIVDICLSDDLDEDDKVLIIVNNFNYNSVDAEAFITYTIKQQEKQKQDEVKRLIKKRIHGYDSNNFKREPISDKTRTFVWNRDSGKCVKCSSNENLEYDHIIPVSKGGSNTARNLQLLCEKCNRQKSNNIA